MILYPVSEMQPLYKCVYLCIVVCCVPAKIFFIRSLTLDSISCLWHVAVSSNPVSRTRTKRGCLLERSFSRLSNLNCPLQNSISALFDTWLYHRQYSVRLIAVVGGTSIGWMSRPFYFRSIIHKYWLCLVRQTGNSSLVMPTLYPTNRTHPQHGLPVRLLWISATSGGSFWGKWLF